MTTTITPAQLKEAIEMLKRESKIFKRLNFVDLDVWELEQIVNAMMKNTSVIELSYTFRTRGFVFSFVQESMRRNLHIRLNDRVEQNYREAPAVPSLYSLALKKSLEAIVSGHIKTVFGRNSYNGAAIPYPVHEDISRELGLNPT